LFTRFVPPRLRRLHGPIKRDLAATFRTPEAMLSVVPDASLRPTFNRRGLSRAGSEVPDRSRAWPCRHTWLEWRPRKAAPKRSRTGSSCTALTVPEEANIWRRRRTLRSATPPS